MIRNRPPGVGVALGALAIVGLLAIVQPWTIRPIQSARTAAFDADAYVAANWNQVIQTAETTAVDVATVRGQPAAGSEPARASRSIFVKGTGVVTNVDVASRVGLAHLRLEGATPPGQVTLQIGPVVRGTAVRDAVASLRFSDFANQTEFAAVANALNERVLQAVLGRLDPNTLSGRVVSFTGATRLGPSSGPIEVVPVALQIQAGGR